MNRFRQSNRHARAALIDLRRPGVVRGAILAVDRGSLDGLFSTPNAQEPGTGRA